MTVFKARKRGTDVKPFNSYGQMPNMYVPIYIYIIVTSKIHHCCGLRTNAKFGPALNKTLLLQIEMHLLCICGVAQ